MFYVSSFMFRDLGGGRKVRMTPGQHDPLMSGATHIIQW